MNKQQQAAQPTGALQRMSASQAMKVAATHARAGRLIQAEGILRQLLQQRPNDAEALHQFAILAHNNGNTPFAVQLIERALSVDPDVHLYQANIAEMCRRLGQVQRAIEHGKRAVALKPDAPDANNNLGIAYFDAGEYATAIVYYDKAIAARPRYAEAFSNRGNALRNLKRFADAEAEYRRALAINPTYAEAYNNLGSVLRDLERPAEAEHAYRRAIQLKPAYVEAANNLVLALKDLERYEEALSLAQDLLAANPQNADALAYIGAIHVDQHKPELAFDVLRRALALRPNKPETINMMGRAFFDTNQPDKAIACFRRAIELKPDLADPYNNLGNALKEMGKLDEALAAFAKSLALSPEQTGPYVNLVDAKKFRSRDDAHLAAIERALARSDTLPAVRVLQINFAAGKAYDDLGLHDLAFAHYAKGNALKRKSISYDEGRILAHFERIREVFSSEMVRDKSSGGFQSARPIFVLGMPRSGTTLIEQILASHARVSGGGELKDMVETVNSVRGGDGNQAPFPEFATLLGKRELTAFGQAYVARLSRHAPAAERITDKMPSNFYFLGLIHLALPGARVIHASRNPVDTCLSCFSKLFAAEQNQTYDLAELGRYYRAYHGLMAHWRQVLPAGAFLDVQYEDVVADTEGQARRILDYCGLEWDARVLDFHRTERSVKTASASQVRRPIYGSSVARWRNYEAHLGPLLAELGELVR